MKLIRHIAAGWEKVATRLYFEPSDIERIKKDNHYQTVPACGEMLVEWLDDESDLRTPVTWDTLIMALKEAGYGEIATATEDIVQGSS